MSDIGKGHYLDWKQIVIRFNTFLKSFLKNTKPNVTINTISSFWTRKICSSTVHQRKSKNLGKNNFVCGFTVSQKTACLRT